VQPGLNLRVGEISRFTNKGRHTTTSARSYNLDIGGQVIDTPGVKHFGLWGVTIDNVTDFFPDVADGEGPDWRRQSYQRIARSLQQED
jgi:ribosome biogenesis GTPase